MIRIKTIIDVKVYAEGKEIVGFCEDYFHGKGVNSPDLYEPLLSYRQKTIELSMANETTLGDFRELIYKAIWNKESSEIIGNLDFCFVISNRLYYIDDPNKPIKNALEECFDSESVDEIHICFVVYEDAGSYYIDRKNGIHYDFHFRESTRHHEPHVHVSDKSKDFNVVINITNGELLPKDYVLDPKYYKKYKIAKEYIADEKNNEDLMKEWKRFTCGFVSIDE